MRCVSPLFVRSAGEVEIDGSRLTLAVCILSPSLIVSPVPTACPMAGSSTSRFQAVLHEETYEMQVASDTVEVDGESHSYRFEALDAHRYLLVLDDQSLPVVVEDLPNGHVRITLDGHRSEVHVKDAKALLLERFGLSDSSTAASREVRAPMPGLVLAVAVSPGQTVQAGDRLVVLEAMKMENELRAEAEATVQTVHVKPGDAVGKNEVLIEFEG